MKKRVLGILILMFALQFITIASAAETCDLKASLINQDPYPVMPGEIVKVVFQVTGVVNPLCGDIEVKLLESFPFELDKGYDAAVKIDAGTYVKDFETFLLVPYKIKVDEDALDGENTLSLSLSSSSAKVTHDFDIEVDDLRTDFEISVKEYNPSTNILTFQILNIGENDVEALTIDVPSQDLLNIRGSARNIVGSLDSNDDTTFSFEAEPKDGDFDLIITYTDGVNQRRTLEKTVSFSSEPFNGRGEKQGMSVWFYITLIIVAIILIRWYLNRRNKKRHLH